LGVQLLLHSGEYFCLPLIEEQVDSKCGRMDIPWDRHGQWSQS
jgi:hypothetical protein